MSAKVKLRAGAMPDAKQLVFFYNGVEATNENGVDLHGEMPLPVKDGMINRRLRNWKVVEVERTEELSKAAPIPVYRIYLSDLL